MNTIVGSQRWTVGASNKEPNGASCVIVVDFPWPSPLRGPIDMIVISISLRPFRRCIERHRCHNHRLHFGEDNHLFQLLYTHCVPGGLLSFQAKEEELHSLHLQDATFLYSLVVSRTIQSR